MTCSKLASGRAVLLGDAAHSVSPNVGMGCNAALQDSEVLSRACIAAGGDVTASAAEYADTRLTNSHVLTRVSERLDAVQSFGYTKDIFAALRGLPYHLVQQAGFGVSSVPGLHASPCPRPCGTMQRPSPFTTTSSSATSAIFARNLYLHAERGKVAQGHFAFTHAFVPYVRSVPTT